MKIIDVEGRIGVVTEQREDGYFARPDGVDQILEDTSGITGVSRARLLTPTWWQRRPDGTLWGLWFDSRSNDFRSAIILEDC